MLLRRLLLLLLLLPVPLPLPLPRRHHLHRRHRRPRLRRPQVLVYHWVFLDSPVPPSRIIA